MQSGAEAMQPDTAMPALSNGEAAEANGHGFVVTGITPHGNLWLDLGLALAVAIALPLALKWLLETEYVSRLLRASRRPAAQSPAAPEEPEEFDFDA